MGDKIDGNIRMEVEEALGNLKQVVKNEDTQNILQRTETLNQVAHKLAQSVYQQPGDQGNHSTSGSSVNADDEIVDAEFEEVA